MITRNSLATAYHAAGRLDEAIPVLERTLTDRERTLGDTHPPTVTTRNNLASAYEEAGRRDDAQRLRDRLADAHQLPPTLGV
jgi:tetratricopeptide (TPR) repeat protein